MTERFCRQVNKRNSMLAVNSGLLRSLFPVALESVDSPYLDVPAIRQEVGSISAVNRDSGFIDVLDSTVGEPIVNTAFERRSNFVSVLADDPVFSLESIVTSCNSKLAAQSSDGLTANAVHRTDLLQRKPFDFVELSEFGFRGQRRNETPSPRHPDFGARDTVLIEPVVNGRLGSAEHRGDFSIRSVLNMHQLPEFFSRWLPKPAALHAAIGRTARNVISAKPSFDGHMRNAKQITDLPRRHALVNVQRSEVLFGWAFSFHKSKYITLDIPRLGYGGQLA